MGEISLQALPDVYAEAYKAYALQQAKKWQRVADSLKAQGRDNIDALVMVMYWQDQAAHKEVE